MVNQIMQDKYILGQSIDQSITALGQEIRLDVALVNNPNGLNGGKVSGKVIDYNGNPIQNALVKIMSSDYDPLMHTLTDGSGQYSFINIDANTSYNIFAIAPGMMLNQGNHFSITNLQQLTINFTLENDPAMILGIIAGDLMDSASGVPINGAIVSLFQIQTDANNILEAVIYTNQYGQFVFREVPIGDYVIKINALGYNENDVNASVDNGGEIVPININLTPNQNIPNGTVSGMITNSNNQPIDRADVILYSMESNNNLTPVAFAKTNINGIYLFDNVPMGRYKVKANEIELVTNNGIMWEYSPYFDSFILSEHLSFNPMQIDLTKGSLLNNATLQVNGQFVGRLGGANNGAVQVNITVQSDGLYNLAVQYLSGDKTSPIKVDVNNVVSNNVFMAGKTVDWTIPSAQILNMPVKLIAGANTLKFYNDTGENAPYISMINLTLTDPSITINATLGTLISGATQTIQGSFVGSIGDTNGGYITLSINVSATGNYDLNIQYLSGSATTTLKIDVNGVYTGVNYSFNKTASSNQTDALMFNTTVDLIAGDNIIKLYNNINTKSPWIGNVTFNPILINVNSSATTGTLSSGAKLTWNNLMVGNLGGPTNESVNMSINIPASGNYILGIQYLTGNVSGSPLKININNNLLGLYTAPYTGTNQLSNSKILNILVSLKQGTNNFIFFNDSGILAPNIGQLSLSLISQLNLIGNAINGTMSGSASLVWNNQFVGGIGEAGNGSVDVNISSLVYSEYMLSLNYLTKGSVSKLLKVQVNSQSAASYILPETNYNYITDAQTYDLVVALNAGNNTINFYNDTGSGSADIGGFTLTRITSFMQKYEARLASLTGDAIVKNTLVTGISSSGGDLTLMVDVPQSGQYDFTMNYTAGDDNSQSNIDVNGINTGIICNFNLTGSWDISSVAPQTITLNLNKGSNTIRIYNIL